MTRWWTADCVSELAKHHYLLEFRADDATDWKLQAGAALHVDAGHVDFFKTVLTPLHRRKDIWLERGGVGYLRMIPVEQVVDSDLPVALNHELLDPRHDLHLASQGNRIETKPPGSSEEVFQRRCRGVMRAEYESFVIGHLRHWSQPMPRFVELSTVEGVEPRNAIEPAVDTI